MSVLENIEYLQRRQSEDLREVRQLLERMDTPLPDPEPFPEIMINNREVQRILSVSETTVTSWTKCGLLTKKKNEKCPTNCYSTTEVLWLLKQKYTHLRPSELRRLIEKRKNEIGF